VRINSKTFIKSAVNLIREIFRFPENVRQLINLMNENKEALHRMRNSLGRLELLHLESRPQKLLREAEFQVYSQWGEDGIIQSLIKRVPIQNKIFIEFGVGDYTESNTRFLLQNNNWAGLIIDGSPDYTARIKQDPIFWRFNLKVECAFIDKVNINEIISQAGISGDVGLLSIDIDGNDYWVWQAIDCISPRIVICEYNGIFGPLARVTIPYDKSFVRTKAHYSNLYYGASLQALHLLARRKGYSLIGSNSAGNNAFFVRDDLVNQLQTHVPEEVYVQAQFRESRNVHGDLSFLSFEDGLDEIEDMLVYDVSLQRNIRIRDIRTKK
jgi:hypothetical protein